MDGWMDGWTDGHMYGQTNGWMEMGWGGGNGECALLDSEAREVFIEKETLE